MWTLKGKGLKAMHTQKMKAVMPRRIMGDFSPSFFQNFFHVILFLQ